MVSPIADLSSLNLTEHVVPEELLRAALPHDHEFRLIDDICFLDLDEQLVVGYKVWDDNPWWARAHIPGRPIMPGVLMLEGCAQVAAVLMKESGLWPADAWIGLGGVTRARFRRLITPPAKVYFCARMGRQSSKIAKYPAQCLINGEVAVDTELLGVPL